MNTSKLENIEAIALIAIIMANQIILNIPKIIITSTGSAAWINTIYIGIIAIITAYLIVKLFKNFPGLDIIDISNYLGGKFLKILMGIAYIVFFITISIFITRNFSETLKTIYFTSSPIIFLILFFVVSACIANQFGIKVIAKVNLIIAPVALISILIILFSTFKNFVPQRLYPILGYGVDKTFVSGLTNIFSFTGLAYLFFLQPLLKKEKSFKKISIISIIISSIYLFLSVTCLLLVFSFIIDSNESISIYLLTRMARYGDIIQRANAIFIFIWILSITSYVSISIFFALHVTKKLVNLSNTNPVNYSFASLILGFALLIKNFDETISLILKYSILIFIFGVNICILTLANIKYKFLNKKNNTT